MKNTAIPSTKGKLKATIHPAISNKLAILCPDFLDSKDYTGLRELAKQLNKQDYTVIRFNPTGIWGSDGNIDDYNTTQYLKDIENVLKCMFKKEKYKHVIIGGHSRGGQVSLLYAAQDPRINLVLAIMPSTGTFKGKKRKDWKNNDYISKRDLPFDRKKTIEYKIPFSHVLDHDKYNVMKDVKKINIPVIMVVGEKDEVVSPEKIKKIYKNINHPKTLISLPEIGHDYRLNGKEVLLVNQKIIEKLKNFSK